MLLALTVERFISVCYPAKARNLCGGRRAYVTVCVIPVATFVLNSPYLFLARVVTCRSETGEGMQGEYNLTSPHLTSPHLTSPHLPHLT